MLIGLVFFRFRLTANKLILVTPPRRLARQHKQPLVQISLSYNIREIVLYLIYAKYEDNSPSLLRGISRVGLPSIIIIEAA